MSDKIVPRIEKPIQSWSRKGLPPFSEEDALYPDSDGQPRGDSSLQFNWITRITDCLISLFARDENVFVAGDHFWYPVEGRPDIRTAPDTMVVFGRPKGDRYSYRQWREDDVAPQVVFEIWSYSTRPGDKEWKLEFYDRYGVEEFYAHDPRPGCQTMEGWLRQESKLVEIEEMNDWISPRLEVKFERAKDEWNLFLPDGEPFLDYDQIYWLREAERAAKEAAWAKLRELGIDPEKL